MAKGDTQKVIQKEEAKTGFGMIVICTNYGYGHSGAAGLIPNDRK